MCSKLAARFPEFPDEPTASAAAGTEVKSISFKRILLNRCVLLITQPLSAFRPSPVGQTPTRFSLCLPGVASRRSFGAVVSGGHCSCLEEFERADERDVDCDGEPVADDLPQEEKDVRFDPIAWPLLLIIAQAFA